MPVEGPYRRAKGSILSYLAILLIGIVWIIIVFSLGAQSSPTYTHRVTVLKDPTPDLRPALDDLESNVAVLQAQFRALAKRIERPAVYRYLDPRPLKLRASRFADPGDKLTGSSSACKLPDDYRRVLPTDYVYAHRDWPCHQLAEICYRGRCVRAIKGTSGPFGCALDEDAEPFETCRVGEKGASLAWCWTTKKREDCEYRGQIDLGAAVANALGMEGIKTVRVRRIKE